MIEYGITTTQAQWWGHLHPLEPAFYYYRVADCLDFIAHVGRQLPFLDGHSKNGDATGRGYLIRKSCAFVTRRRLHPARVNWIDWTNLTDRQSGYRYGEPIAQLLISLGILGYEPDELHVINSRRDQFRSCDCMVVHNGEAVRWEFKTECVRSQNLFVQCAEGWHDPNVRPDGSVFKTPMHPLEP